MQYRGRLFTGRHVMSGRHMQVDKEAVTSRHVTSRQDVTGAAVDKEAVTSRHGTSRHVRTSQVPPWTRRPSRHVTSRHVRTSQVHVTSRQDITGAAVDKDAVIMSHHVTSRHVTSRHVTTSGAPRADHAPDSEQ